MLRWLQRLHRFVWGSFLEERSGDRGREILGRKKLGRDRSYRAIEEERVAPIDPEVLAAEQELLRALKWLHNHPGAPMMNPYDLAQIFLSIPGSRRLVEAIEWDSFPGLPLSWDLHEEFRLTGGYYKEHFQATALEIRRLILELGLLQEPKQGDCYTCRFFSGSQFLKCAVNPGRSMDEDCGHWKKR